jgi:hypothetical protein
MKWIFLTIKKLRKIKSPKFFDLYLKKPTYTLMRYDINLNTHTQY